MRQFHEMIGVSYNTFSRGKRANMISPYGEVSKEARELIMKQMERIYDDFLSHVAKGRNLPKEAVASVAEGRVWTGGQAMRHGLVDELGGLQTAVAKARDLGNIPADAEILSLPEPKTFFEILQEMQEVNVSIRAIALGLPGQVKKLLHHLDWIHTAREEHVFAVIPELIVVR